MDCTLEKKDEVGQLIANNQHISVTRGLPERGNKQTEPL